MPRFEVMIGNKGVKKYEAPNKAAAYKLAVKDNCKEGELNFMKMTEAVITKEILPIFKSFEFDKINKVAQTLMFFYDANKDPDIKEGGEEMIEEFGDDDRSLDDILNDFFVKNKTKAIAKFKKNLFTMLRSGVFYLRFLNDPQVLFCNKEEVVEGVVDLVGIVPPYNGGGAFMREGALDRLKKFNGSILPILSYDRKKIASDEEYKKKFLNIYYTFAAKANYTKTEEAEEVFLKIADPVEEEDETGEDDTRTQREKREDIEIAKENEAEDKGFDDTFRGIELYGKDYDIRLRDNALFQDDEDGEPMLVGYRDIKRITNKKTGKSKARNVIVERPSKEEYRAIRRLARQIFKEDIEEIDREREEFLASGRNLVEEEADREEVKDLKEEIAQLKKDLAERQEVVDDLTEKMETDMETDPDTAEFINEGKEILKDEVRIRKPDFTFEEVDDLPDDKKDAVYSLSQLIYLVGDISPNNDFLDGRMLIGTAFRQIVFPFCEIFLEEGTVPQREDLDRVKELQDRIRELEQQLLEQINSKPELEPEEPKSDFADVSKLLQEIADLTEAREKERGEIVKVQKLEIQVESLNRMIDNLVDERDDYAILNTELEKKLEERPETVKEEEETDEDLQDNFDALSGILNSLGVDVDEVLEAVKQEDDLFDFFEEPEYKNLVLKPISQELEFKGIDTDDEDED